MSLVTILGGARSGKSTAAEAWARRWPGAVVYIATAEGGDDEMRERIERHRARRPPEWLTLEEPIALATALDRAVDALALIDCLSLWVSNLAGEGQEDDAVIAAARSAARVAAERQTPTIAVSNEVGLGVVPASPLGRRYRDLLGLVNQEWVAASGASYFVVAGRLLPLHEFPEGLHDV
ncbi:MAG: bifunctional adenosylcobinamide kinase/adenosylcobinamide-phosphate guanylyltransferase [Gaiellaceae bacterium]